MRVPRFPNLQGTARSGPGIVAHRRRRSARVSRISDGASYHSVELDSVELAHHGPALRGIGPLNLSQVPRRARKEEMAMSTDDDRTPELDEATRSALWARLVTERDRLRGILQGLEAEEREAEPPVDEVEDFGEMGLDLMQEDTAQALAADQRRLLAQVERALQRMEEGTYGVSEVSGNPIPLERLEAMPWATTTIDDPEER